MKKFELNGIEYGFNEETGRYSKTENGKTKRIGKAEYEEAASVPTNIRTIPAEDGKNAVQFAKFGTNYGVKLVGDEGEFHKINCDEIKNMVDKRDPDGKFSATFEFMGRRYWVKDAIVEGEKKKTTRKRRPKDVAYRNDDLEITLTSKQVDFCTHLPDTAFWDNGLDSTPWVDVLCDEIGGQFRDRPMTVGAMVSTLKEKGLINVDRDDSRQGKPKYLCLTDKGKAIFKDLGVK